MAPMTELIKGSSFNWIFKAQYAFEEIKSELTQALIHSCRALTRFLRLDMTLLELVFYTRSKALSLI